MTEGACSRCGGTEWRDALAPEKKKRLVLVGEALFAVFAAVGVAWRSVPAAVVTIFGALFAFAVTLRSRQQSCAKCGYLRAIPAAPPRK